MPFGTDNTNFYETNVSESSSHENKSFTNELNNLTVEIPMRIKNHMLIVMKRFQKVF